MTPDGSLATRRIAQPSALIRAGTPLAGALLRRSGALGLRVLGGLVSPEDLAVVGQTEERHVAEKLASGLTGLALPLLLATVLGVAGGVLQTTIAIPLAVPLWLALVLGLGGFIAPDLVVRRMRSPAAARWSTISPSSSRPWRCP